MRGRATPDRAGLLAWGLAALATLALTFSSGAQQPSPQVFRAEANLVYVDAYPRQGERLVEGLTAQDFQVFEDGKPQTVQTFEFIRFASSPVDSDRRDPTTVADSERQAADPRNRIFVIYLDRHHTTRNGSRDSRQPLVDFLNQTIGASDLFAVMTPEMPVSGLTFARRTDTIEAELSKFWDWGERDQLLTPRTPAEEQIVNCAMQAYRDVGPRVDAIHRRFRENLTHNSLEGLIRRLRDLRDERTNLLLVTEGWVPERNREDLAKLPVGPGQAPIPVIGVGRGGQIVRGNPQSGNPDEAGCRAEVAALADVNFIERFRDLIAAAEQANVTFYPVDVGGLQGNLRPTETLRTLAGATDGYAAVNSNDLAAGFRRIAERLSSYYLLGYYSTNTVNDGKFRKIEVKVPRAGVSVTARRGYLAPPSDAVVAAAKANAPASTVRGDVSAALERLARIGSDQEVFATTVVRGSSMDIVADLAERDVDKGRWGKGAAVEVTVTDATGTTTVGHGTIEAGRRAVLVRVPFASEQKAPWRVRLRVTGEQGSVETRVDAETTPADHLGPPIVLRGTGAARAAMQPVAELSFRRTERLRVQWPMGPDGRQLTAQILDRRGQPLGSALPSTESDGPSGERLVSFDLALGSLASGDYLIQLTAGQGAGAEQHLVPFRVAR